MFTMEQTSSSKNAIHLQNPVATLQAIRLFEGEAITLPPEVTILFRNTKRTT